MAATMKIDKAFKKAKYLIWNMPVKMNQATGMDMKISRIPTPAKKNDPVLILSQKKTKTRLKIASKASQMTILTKTSKIREPIK